jgi:hypothetical protein
MHTNVREIVAESRFHERPREYVEGLAGCTNGFIDQGWCCRHGKCAFLDALGLHAILGRAPLLNLTLALGAPSAAGASALESRLRHPHHPLSDAVCLLLIFVSRLVDR